MSKRHSEHTEQRHKKKKNRWGSDESQKTFIPGMPTMLPPNMSEDQQKLYLLQLQIEDLSRKLRSGDYGIPTNPEDRSPSPEPLYNTEGKRLNTREYRTRRRLEDDRHNLIQQVLALNSSYKPPMDYKPPTTKMHDKVYIPQDQFPDINFVGLLIGPRGNTLKNLEKETGAKVIIRGKGSVKEGKIGRKDGMPLPGEDDELHAYITATSIESVNKALEKINTIIKEGIEVPEAQNDLRKQQLRELALLNGTLRESDGLLKLRQLAEASEIITNTIICAQCGGAGHVAADCKERRPGESLRGMHGGNMASDGSKPGVPQERRKMDNEYLALMSELGVQHGGPHDFGLPPVLGGPGSGSFSSSTVSSITSGGSMASNGGFGRNRSGQSDPPLPSQVSRNWGPPPPPIPSVSVAQSGGPMLGPNRPSWMTSNTAANNDGNARPMPSLMSLPVDSQQSWSMLPPPPGGSDSPLPPPPRPPPGFEQWIQKRGGPPFGPVVPGISQGRGVPSSGFVPPPPPPGPVQSVQPPAPGVDSSTNNWGTRGFSQSWNQGSGLQQPQQQSTQESWRPPPAASGYSQRPPQSQQYTSHPPH